MTAARLTPARFGVAYVVVAVAVVALDAVWLGVVAGDLYKREMGSLMAGQVHVVPALVFYLLYPLAIVILVLGNAPSGWGEALLRSAVLGLAAYGAYNLTNLAIVRGWPLGLSLIDWTWGGFATAIAGAAGYRATWARAGA
jgi:uncharacterized membrane protein